MHRLLFEIELPMTMLVAVVVWFALYPNAVSVAQQTGDYSGQIAVPNPHPNPDPNYSLESSPGLHPGPNPSPKPSSP